MSKRALEHNMEPQDISTLLNELEDIKKSEGELALKKRDIQRTLSEALQPIYKVSGTVHSTVTYKKYRQTLGYFSSFSDAHSAMKKAKNTTECKITVAAKGDIRYYDKNLKVDGPICDDGYHSD